MTFTGQPLRSLTGLHPRHNCTGDICLLQPDTARSSGRPHHEHPAVRQDTWMQQRGRPADTEDAFPPLLRREVHEDSLYCERT